MAATPLLLNPRKIEGTHEIIHPDCVRHFTETGGEVRIGKCTICDKPMEINRFYQRGFVLLLSNSTLLIVNSCQTCREDYRGTTGYMTGAEEHKVLFHVYVLLRFLLKRCPYTLFEKWVELLHLNIKGVVHQLPHSMQVEIDAKLSETPENRS